MSFIEKIGFKYIELVNEQVKSGKDTDGKPFAPYSFAYWRRKKRKKSTAKTRKGKMAARARFESEWNSDKNNVTMTLTGDMLSALNVLKVERTAGKIECFVGFADKEAAAKAYYHNIAGAGKRRVLRRFLGLSAASERKLKEFIGGEANVRDDATEKELKRLLDGLNIK